MGTAPLLGVEGSEMGAGYLRGVGVRFPAAGGTDFGLLLFSWILLLDCCCCCCLHGNCEVKEKHTVQRVSRK